MKPIYRLVILALTVTSLLSSAVLWFSFTPLATFIFLLTTALLVQGAFATFGMLYSYLEPKNVPTLADLRGESPQTKKKFSLIIPARHEQKVIGNTLKAFNQLNYPKSHYELLIAVRLDDEQTIEAVEKALDQLKNPNLRLVIVGGQTINKAVSLNQALKKAKSPIIGVFDAEDEPHPDILNSINTAFTQSDIDVVQSSIQLINVTPHWFAPFNCLEYYFWFRSVLPMFARLGSTPLGGNTVFFRKKALDAVGGWNESALTEDADIGIRLSRAGFKPAIIYSTHMATLEETPTTQLGFIQQRSRWDHGYLQVLFKGDWLKLPTLKQQLLTAYLLMQPLILHLSILGILLMPIMGLFAKIPIGLSLYSFVPLYFLLMQVGIKLIGLWELRKHYNLDFSNKLFLSFAINYIPYQFLLAFASFRALLRFAFGFTNWEKTAHVGAHRLIKKHLLSYAR